jgi:hypothetical protein
MPSLIGIRQPVSWRMPHGHSHRMPKDRFGAVFAPDNRPRGAL